MRNLLLISSLAFLFSSSLVVAQTTQSPESVAKSISAGSQVVVVGEGVELKAGTEVVAPLTKGERFKVLAVRDEWIGLQTKVNGVLRSGWVLRSQVATAPADSKKSEGTESYQPQVVGELGSPAATTTIAGKQLPAPQPPFGGVIKDDALNSKAWWAPRIVPPKGAPNVLLILTDDAGFGVPSTFGGVIPTPAMDRIANNGLRYNRIFSTSLCSPTRAALITGRNHHSVGFGVIAEQATGFPGYDSIIGVDNATIGAFFATMAMRRLGLVKTTTPQPMKPARQGRSRSGPPVWASTTFTASLAGTPTSGGRTSSATPLRSIRGLVMRAR